MNADHEDRLKKLLQEALRRIEGEPEPGRDLWPKVLRRVEARPAVAPWLHAATLDWALLAGFVAFVAFVPRAIPVLLYYL